MRNNNPVTDKHFVEGLRSENDRILKDFISEYFPRISSFLKKQGAADRDLKDLTMIVLTAAFQNIRKPDFELTAPLSTYLFSIARFQFFKYLKKNKRLDLVTIPEDRVFTSDEDLQKGMELAEKTKLLWDHFYKLGQTCQQVLLLWLDKISMKEIAGKLFMPSEGAARAKKFDCLRKLKTNVWSDGRYAEMTS